MGSSSISVVPFEKHRITSGWCCFLLDVYFYTAVTSVCSVPSKYGIFFLYSLLYVSDHCLDGLLSGQEIVNNFYGPFLLALESLFGHF